MKLQWCLDKILLRRGQELHCPYYYQLAAYALVREEFLYYTVSQGVITRSQF